jgi:hypothetical protein
MSNDRGFQVLAASALLLFIVDLAPLPTQADETPHPKTTGYLDVQDVPRHETPAMTADQQLKLKNELSATRDRQTTSGKAIAHPTPTKPVKP